MNRVDHIGIRVSPAEKEAFRFLAEREGVTESELLRNLVRESLKACGFPAPTLAYFYNELKKEGAHVAN